MKVWLGLVSIVMLLQVKPAGVCSLESPFLKDILESPGFLHVVLTAAKEARLDISIPQVIIADEARHFARFLKRAPVAVRIFNKEHEFGAPEGDASLHNDRRALLVLYCGGKRNGHPPKSSYEYFVKIFAICFSFIDTNNRVLEIMKTRSIFYAFLHNRQVFFAGNLNLFCLNCPSSLQNVSTFRLVDNVSLARTHFTVYCHNPYICEQSQLALMRDIFELKNASLSILKVSTFEQYAESMERMMQKPSTLVYIPYRVKQVTFPASSVVSYYDTVKVRTFVRSPERLLKEAVLGLPFDKITWSGIFISFFLSITASFFLTRVECTKKMQYSSIALPFVASAVQQSYPLSGSLEKSNSFRIVMCIWSFAVIIFSTGYKGVLISLLWNVPLESAIFDPSDEAKIAEMRVDHCFLNFPEEWLFMNYSRRSRSFRYGSECLDQSGKVHTEANRKDLFHIFGSGFQKVYVYMSYLTRRNYVQTKDFYSPLVTGPEIRSSSPYRKAISKSFNRAFEVGLFKSATRFSEFTSERRHNVVHKLPLMGEEAMTLSDLRPCFIVWTAGIALCTLALAVECGAHRNWKRFAKMRGTLDPA